MYRNTFGVRALFLPGVFCLLSSLLSVSADNGAIPIHQVDVPFAISESGSYVVAEQLQRSGAAGSVIGVYADDVQIDLAGNSVAGPSLGTSIYQASSNLNLDVKNGHLMRGILAEGSHNRFEDLVVHFGLGEARVFPTYWREAQKIEKDKKLKKKIFKLK